MRFLFLICTLIITNAYAQYSLPIQPWADEVEGRTLVVRLVELTEKQAKKMEPEKIKQRKASNNRHNERLMRLIPKYWTLNKDIEFKTSSEIDEIVKNKDERYVILACKWGKETNMSVKVYYTYKAYAMLLVFPEKAKKVLDFYQFDSNDNGNASYLKRRPYIFKVSMMNYFVNERDVKYACKQFQDHVELAKTIGYPGKISIQSFNFAPIDSSLGSILNTKTVLFPKEMLQIDESIIASNYHAPYKLVSFAEIDSLISNDANNEYVYYQVVWSERDRYWNLAIIDNEDGKLIGFNPAFDKKFQLILGGSFGSNTFSTFYRTPNGSFVINQEHLDNLNKLMLGK